MPHPDPQRSAPRIPEGTYLARGLPASVQFGYSSQGAPQIAAQFRIIEGELAGEALLWYGHFTAATEPRTLEALRAAGWTDDDLGHLRGFGDADVEIVVEHHEWEGKVQARIAWVNRPGGAAAFKRPMSEDQRRAFAAKMKGAAERSRTAPDKTTRGAAADPRPAPTARPRADRHPNAPDDDDVAF